MSTRFLSYAPAVLCVVLAAPSFADDPTPAPPPASSPAPAPTTSSSTDTRDPLDLLVGRLVSADASVRADAERHIESASAETLRDVVRAMRRRLLAASGEECWVPTTVGVRQEVSFAVMTSDQVAALFGGAANGADAVIVTPTAEILNRWAEAESSGAPKILHYPQVTNYDGQKRMIDVGSQRSYIGDYEVQIDGGRNIADPIIQQVATGLSLGLTARTSADRSRIEVAIDFDHRRLVEPIAEEKLELVKGADPVRIQRPEVVGSRWQRTLSIASGGDVFIVFPRSFDGGSADHYLVLRDRATVIDLSALPADGKPASSPK
jgi:hypothetical protein